MVSHAVGLLREHPEFDVPVPGEEVAVLTHDEREEAWARETLELLHRRIKFVWLAMMIAIPALWMFYVCLEPAQRVPITMAEGMMVGVCSILYYLAQKSDSVRLIRFCALLAYSLFAVTASTVMILAKNDLRAVALSGHPQLVVALLFIPFSVLEAGACTAFISLVFCAGLYKALPNDQHALIPARTLSLALSGSLVLLMTHLQGLSRRRAFDAAFNMAVSASQGATLSNSDFLTGGANRRHFEAMLEVELARSARHHRPISMLLFDLDGFKTINDTFGHTSGDEILCEIFRAAQETVRGSDVLARWGGDEFALALVETDCQDASRTAERLQQVVAQRLKSVWGEGSLQSRVTLSIGIACVHGDEPVSLIEVVDRADAALYQSKRNGKNRVTVG